MSKPKPRKPGEFVYWLTLAASLVIVLAIVKPARAHSWYGHECCSDKDCRPLPDKYVREVAKGYVLSIPGRPEELVTLGDARLKTVPAEHDYGKTFHICMNAGQWDAFILCLYAPGKGV